MLGTLVIQGLTLKPQLRALRLSDDNPVEREVRWPARGHDALAAAMRAADEIGDDAFHRIEEELDWLEMAGGTE